MPEQHKEEGMDKAVTKKIAEFLFEKPEAQETGEFLDIRTDVNTKSMFSALLYYRVLGGYFKCKAATTVANILERLSISTNREGRREAVISLMQKIQSSKFLPGGMDALMQKLQEEYSGEPPSSES